MDQKEFDRIEAVFRAEIAERFGSGTEWKIALDNCEAEGTLGFVVLWAVSETWANVCAFSVEEVEERPDGDIKHFSMPNRSNDMTTDIMQANRYIDGFVKWDGCAELDQGRPHWCGPYMFKAHMGLLEFIYRRAMELMGRGEGMYPWGGNERDSDPSGVVIKTIPRDEPFYAFVPGEEAES